MNKVHRLFIVDDDNLFTHITSLVVDDSDLVEEVKVYNNGKEAYDYLSTHRDSPEKLPDVILLDLSMPIMDGWGFLDKFMNLKLPQAKTIEIYICSSSISPEEIEKARSMSVVSDYIIKPLTRDKLIKMIGEI
ncbi:MAG: response regulator [Cyclobacteriaceae bacterium]|nr:response regulator [Cyclobacteriaceae bacterium SS2]